MGTTPQTPQEVLCELLCEWIYEWIEGRDAVELDELKDAVREHFADDRAFQEAAVDHALNTLLLADLEDPQPARVEDMTKFDLLRAAKELETQARGAHRVRPQDRQ